MKKQTKKLIEHFHQQKVDRICEIKGGSTNSDSTRMTKDGKPMIGDWWE